MRTGASASTAARARASSAATAPPQRDESGDENDGRRDGVQPTIPSRAARQLHELDRRAQRARDGVLEPAVEILVREPGVPATRLAPVDDVPVRAERRPDEDTGQASRTAVGERRDEGDRDEQRHADDSGHLRPDGERRRCGREPRRRAVRPAGGRALPRRRTRPRAGRSAPSTPGARRLAAWPRRDRRAAPRRVRGRAGAPPRRRRPRA